MPNSFPKVAKHHHCCLREMQLATGFKCAKRPWAHVLNLFEALQRQEWEH